MGCCLLFIKHLITELGFSKAAEKKFYKKSYRIILNYELRDEKNKSKNIPIHRTMSLFYFELNLKKKLFQFFDRQIQ